MTSGMHVRWQARDDGIEGLARERKGPPSLLGSGLVHVVRIPEFPHVLGQRNYSVHEGFKARVKPKALLAKLF